MKIKEHIKEWLERNKWFMTIFWIIVTAIITISIERSCNRIIPEDPVVIKEISDTIKFVHTYDFGALNDSSVNAQLLRRLENIELAQKYEAEIIKKDNSVKMANSIMLDASFPNMKGYSPRKAMSFFSFEMSSLNDKLIEFELSFFDQSMLDDIYCLTLKIFTLDNNQRIYYEEQFYNVNNTRNIIRIANSLPKGKLEFCVGFVLKRDRLSEYPNTYQISKIVSKTR